MTRRSLGASLDALCHQAIAPIRDDVFVESNYPERSKVRAPPFQMAIPIVGGFDAGRGFLKPIDRVGERADARHPEVPAVINVALDLARPCLNFIAVGKEAEAGG